MVWSLHVPILLHQNVYINTIIIFLYSISQTLQDSPSLTQYSKMTHCSYQILLMGKESCVLFCYVYFQPHKWTYYRASVSFRTNTILPISPIFSALLPVPVDATDEQPIMMTFYVVNYNLYKFKQCLCHSGICMRLLCL